jgi:hypothetical protein
MIHCWRDEASLPAPDATALLACGPLIVSRGLALAELLDELVAGRWDEATTAFDLRVFVEHAPTRQGSGAHRSGDGA